MQHKVRGETSYQGSQDEPGKNTDDKDASAPCHSSVPPSRVLFWT